MRTYWMSFVGEEGHLGCCIVDVDEAEIDQAAEELKRTHPDHDPERGPVIWAAAKKAHALGINPGGSIQAIELPYGYPQVYPKHKLMTALEVREYEKEWTEARAKTREGLDERSDPVH